jgi:hypothetical protein
VRAGTNSLRSASLSVPVSIAERIPECPHLSGPPACSSLPTGRRPAPSSGRPNPIAGPAGPASSRCWEARVKANERWRGRIDDEIVSRVVGREFLRGFDEDRVEAVAVLTSRCRDVGGDCAAHELFGFDLAVGRDDQAGPRGPARFVVLISNPTFHGALG